MLSSSLKSKQNLFTKVYGLISKISEYNKVREYKFGSPEIGTNMVCFKLKKLNPKHVKIGELESFEVFSN